MVFFGFEFANQFLDKRQICQKVNRDFAASSNVTTYLLKNFINS